MYSSNLIGFILACVSSAFIGSSFIIKKKGLKRAGVSGPSASVGGYGYLLEPLWWLGMVSMIVGEIANFVAYIYAPAVLVTPLGALSIIVSAVLAHIMLHEKLQKMGIIGCLLCIVGSAVIVLHAPSERTVDSVEEIWDLAIQPGYECKGYWHCHRAHCGGNIPIQVLPIVGVCYGCHYLYYHSTKLPKHGIGYIQYSSCLSDILCIVHFIHNFSQCNYVQGLFWSKCKQYCFRTLRLHNCAVRYNNIAQYKGARANFHHRSIHTLIS